MVVLSLDALIVVHDDIKEIQNLMTLISMNYSYMAYLINIFDQLHEFSDGSDVFCFISQNRQLIISIMHLFSILHLYLRYHMQSFNQQPRPFAFPDDLSKFDLYYHMKGVDSQLDTFIGVMKMRMVTTSIRDLTMIVSREIKNKLTWYEQFFNGSYSCDLKSLASIAIVFKITQAYMSDIRSRIDNLTLSFQNKEHFLTDNLII